MSDVEVLCERSAFAPLDSAAFEEDPVTGEGVVAYIPRELWQQMGEPAAVYVRVGTERSGGRDNVPGCPCEWPRPAA